MGQDPTSTFMPCASPKYSFAIVDDYLAHKDQKLQSKKENICDSEPKGNLSLWSQVQIPRILTGIGDLYVSKSNFCHAVDAYTRAIPYREANVEALKSVGKESREKRLQYLEQSRLLCESNVLVAETLLRCPRGKDVTVKINGVDKQRVLVTAVERVDFARGYYEKARDDLQHAGSSFEIYALQFYLFIYFLKIVIGQFISWGTLLEVQLTGPRL